MLRANRVCSKESEARLPTPTFLWCCTGAGQSMCTIQHYHSNPAHCSTTCTCFLDPEGVIFVEVGPVHIQ